MTLFGVKLCILRQCHVHICNKYVFSDRRRFTFNMTELGGFVIDNARFFLSLDVADPMYSAVCGQSFSNGHVACRPVFTRGVPLSNEVNSMCFEFSATNWFKHHLVKQHNTVHVSVSNCLGNDASRCSPTLLQNPFLILTVRGKDSRDGDCACPMPAPKQGTNLIPIDFVSNHNS